jgi:23S rRNA (cytosine1962-C5)-methyltransferase
MGACARHYGVGFSADAIFAGASGDDEDAGRWRFNRELPQSWTLQWDDISFISRPTPFRHLAFFPEHSVHWRYARDYLKAHRGAQPEVLNLFGYTPVLRHSCARRPARKSRMSTLRRRQSALRATISKLRA